MTQKTVCEVERDGDSLIATIPMLPAQVKELEVDVEDRVLRVSAAGVSVEEMLPCVVDGEASQAKYQKKKQQLTVVMPIVRELRPAEFPAGTPVRISGLKGRADLNGHIGEVIGPQGQRIGVSVSGEKVCLKPENLMAVTGQSDPADAVVTPTSPASPATSPCAPPPFLAESRVQVAASEASVAADCRSHRLPWFAEKCRWLGKEVRVVTVDVRDRTAQVKYDGSQSLCWFPFSTLTVLSAPSPQRGGIAVGGDD